MLVVVVLVALVVLVVVVVVVLLMMVVIVKTKWIVFTLKRQYQVFFFLFYFYFSFSFSCFSAFVSWSQIFSCLYLRVNVRCTHLLWESITDGPGHFSKREFITSSSPIQSGVINSSNIYTKMFIRYIPKKKEKGTKRTNQRFGLSDHQQICSLIFASKKNK